MNLLAVALVILLSVVSISAQNTALRWNHLQTVGTHNSYHVLPPRIISSWNYSQPIPYQQLQQGVRQFEFDVHDGFGVYHADTYDANSNCGTLSVCLGSVQSWSAANPTHAPIFVMLELKTSQSVAQFDAIDQIILSAFGRSGIVTPDDVRGSSATLKDAVLNQGWPTIESTRGKVVMMLLSRQDNYVLGDHAGLVNRTAFVLFAPADAGVNDINVMYSIDTSTDSHITPLVQQGFIVRTRADSDLNRGDINRTDTTAKNDYFFAMDLDNSNTLSKAEVNNFLAALEFSLSAATVNGLFAFCGAGAGQMTFPQFLCATQVAASQGVNLIPVLQTIAGAKASRDAAFASGAQIVSTDWNTISCTNHPLTNYFVEIPGGLTYRCNPVTGNNPSLYCQNSNFENVRVPICSGSLGLDATTFCASVDHNEWTYGQGYYCGDSVNFYQCWGSSPTQGIYFSCPAGTNCVCIPGAECSNHGTQSPCQ